MNAPASGAVKPGWGRILTFALNGTAKLQAPPFGHEGPPRPAITVQQDARTVHRGGLFYNSNCLFCHGLNAVAGPLPDLRYSSKGTRDSFGSIVLGGHTGVQTECPHSRRFSAPGRWRRSARTLSPARRRRRRRRRLHSAVEYSISTYGQTSARCSLRDCRGGRAFSQPAPLAAIDRLMENYRLDTHVPGMVWGVVKDGKLIHRGGAGVQDIEAKRPVNGDTLFRIASMTKPFTALSILKLRDEGRLSLDAPAENHAPEMRGWKYPTEDSPKIRARDLLTHSAGFVTDDQWGDRQSPLPEEEFTRLLRAGAPFASAPGTAMEYSNLEYALLGRIVANVSKQPYKEFVESTLLEPLGIGGRRGVPRRGGCDG